jgi:hypothetical protein
MQFAEKYSTENQLLTVREQFKTWDDIRTLALPKTEKGQKKGSDKLPLPNVPAGYISNLQLRVINTKP